MGSKKKANPKPPKSKKQLDKQIDIWFKSMGWEKDPEGGLRRKVKDKNE